MKNYLLILCFLAGSLGANAQIKDLVLKEKPKRSFGLAIVPQYAFMKGMRVDADMRIGKQNTLTIAPQLYYANNTYINGYSVDEYKGAGLKLNYRHFPGKKGAMDGVYVGLGLDYKYKEVTYNDIGFYSYQEDGLEYQTTGELEKNTPFHKGGFDLTIGYQLFITSEFFMDFYAGYGFRLSNYTYENAETNRDWGDNILAPGYTGFIPMAGFRIGLMLK